MKTTSPRRLPVLMYHQVSNDRVDGLTVSSTALEKQLEWLVMKGYEAIDFMDLKRTMETEYPLPGKPVIITFDDAYSSFETLASPLLQKFGLKSTLFVPVAYMGKTNAWDQGREAILTVDQINSLQNTGRVEVGIHSFLHRNYAEMAIEDMKDDLENCFQTLEYHKIRISRVLAYPYGGFPKKDPELKGEMKRLFSGMDLWFALRIGNRINRLPLKDRYEINRVDIKGTDSFHRFKHHVKFGKKHPFTWL